MGWHRRCCLGSDGSGPLCRDDIGPRVAGDSIKPLRLGRPEAAAAYQALIGNITNLAIENVDLRSARLGAELRAKYGLRTPDSLHIAACLANEAEAFVTTDRRSRRVKEIEVIVLDDFA